MGDAGKGRCPDVERKMMLYIDAINMFGNEDVEGTIF
jgi:hypothetical protein